MRIDYTNYYTSTEHLSVYDPVTKRRHFEPTPVYVLSVYGQSLAHIYRLKKELKRNEIKGHFSNHIYDSVPLPHIWIQDPASIERLETLLQAQGIVLPENRFQQRTDWQDVLNFEKSKHPSLLQNLWNASLR